MRRPHFRLSRAASLAAWLAPSRRPSLCDLLGNQMCGVFPSLFWTKPRVFAFLYCVWFRFDILTPEKWFLICRAGHVPNTLLHRPLSFEYGRSMLRVNRDLRCDLGSTAAPYLAREFVAFSLSDHLPSVSWQHSLTRFWFHRTRGILHGLHRYYARAAGKFGSAPRLRNRYELLEANTKDWRNSYDERQGEWLSTK